MKKHFFLDESQYISDELYKQVASSLLENMKGSGSPLILIGTPKTITCIKPSNFNDGIIRETSPGIYPLQQKQYIKIKGASNDMDK